MPTTKFKYTRVKRTTGEGEKTHHAVSREDFNLFKPALLGLGNLSADGEYVQALVAFLDLHGFTTFCNQVDAHLVIPEFLRSYIDWLFEELRKEFVHSESEDQVVLWSKLPLFTKFLGDGILFIWDTESAGKVSLRNIAVTLQIICSRYREDFLPKITRQLSKPPSALRCGIARGQIISVGQGRDYVGPCINVASRLQKLSQLRFAIAKRGFDLQAGPKDKFFETLILKKVVLSGIRDEELVYVKRDEFDALPAREKKLFKDP